MTSPSVAVGIISQKEIADVARRQFQDPPIGTHETKRGLMYWIRFRRNVLDIKDGNPYIRRKDDSENLCLVKEGIRKAEREKARIMAEVNGAVYTLQSQVPFGEFVETWKEQHYRGIRLNTIKIYDHLLARWVQPAFSDMQLGQISPLDVSRLLGAMEVSGMARSTRQGTKSLIKTIFRCARAWGYIADNRSNPATDAQVGRAPGATREMWTPTLEEALAIIAAAREPVSAILETILWTGMRISEALGLRWRNVDLTRGVAIVNEQMCQGHVGDTKSRAGRRELPLGTLVDRLGTAGQPDHFVFGGADGWRTNTLTHKLHPVLVALNMVHHGNAWHSFRRLHLTMASEHLTEFQLRRQAGHSSVAMTQRYIADRLEARQDAIRDMQAKVVPIRRGA